MDVIQIVLIVWLMTVLTVYVGARIGLAVGKGKDLNLPNPIKAIEEHREKMEYKAEREVYEINMANIDVYDGTELGQQDFN